MFYVQIIAIIAALAALFFVLRKIAVIEKKIIMENQLRDLIVDGADYTIWVIKGETMQLSAKFARRAHMPSSSMKLSQLATCVMPESKDAWDLFQRQYRKTGRHHLRLHFLFYDTPHWYEFIYQAENDTTSGIMIQVDKAVARENEMKKLQEGIQEVALKQSFLSNISHDLRTPLNAVTGFTQLMTAEGIELSEDEMKEYNGLIHQNSELMLRMIDGVMMKSQIETGDTKMKPMDVSATKFIHDTYHTHLILTPANITLKAEQDTPDCIVSFDLHRTQQVMNNFLSNAFKFTPEGSVTIGWKKIADTNEVEFYCQDTGIGVSEENAKHLFDRFYKVSEKSIGTGLGLNISRTIIEKQGGTIGVESKVGHGSRFWFRFPLPNE